MLSSPSFEPRQELVMSVVTRMKESNRRATKYKAPTIYKNRATTSRRTTVTTWKPVSNRRQWQPANPLTRPQWEESWQQWQPGTPRTGDGEEEESGDNLEPSEQDDGGHQEVDIYVLIYMYLIVIPNLDPARDSKSTQFGSSIAIWKYPIW